MKFRIMPDDLYGASARVNGQWLGVVETRPLSFTVSDQGEFYLLVELTPLISDPSGDVYAIPIARVLHIREGEVQPPAVESDGVLHLRRDANDVEIHYRYPKVDAPTRYLETLPQKHQVETVDLDKDGRLDTVESYITNKNGHVRIRLADGTELFEGVFPDPRLQIVVADINRDGRPDVLVLWQDPEEEDPLHAAKLMLWESPEGAIDTFSHITGVKRIGAGDVLLERTRRSPFRSVTEYLRYTRKPWESATFVPVRTEERLLQRAETVEETAEAFLTALEQQDHKGAHMYLARGKTLSSLAIAQCPFYAHRVDAVQHAAVSVTLYEWLYPHYYDCAKTLHLEFVQEPDKWSEWKVHRVLPR